MPRIRIDLPATFPFAIELPVRITDVNYGGHLGNDALLSLLHEARCRFLLHHGCSEANTAGVGMVMVDAARRSSARRITAVIPYYGYARKDRKEEGRVPITAKLVANLLVKAGVDRVLALDLHATQIQGFFDVPVDHLSAVALFIPYIQQMGLREIVVASPDVGGTKRANVFAKHLKTDLVICHKSRSKANQIDSMTLIGDVEGKDVIIVDDIIDTAGTITKAADLMKSKGANSVRAFVTHAVLSGPAFERIEGSYIDEVLVTDSIPIRRKSDKITVISCAPLFADVIQKVYENKSISTAFI